MKVIYLMTKLQKGMGPVNQAYNLGSAMKALGMDFTIVCMNPELPQKTWKDKFEEAGIKVVHLDKSAKDITGTYKALKKYVTENNVDIIHSSGLRPDLYNVMLGKTARHYTTQRCEPRNIMEKSNKVVALISEKIMLGCLKKMDMVIACSEALEQHIKGHCRIEATHVQNGVDVDYFKPVGLKEKGEMRKKLGLPDNGKIYLYCGALLDRKDLHTLLKGFMEMPDKEVRILVVAGGKPEQVQHYKELYNSPNIIYLGNVEKPLPYVQCADYAISASLSEGLPNSILESMACGIPSVLSDIEPHKELMKSGNIGKIFQTKNVADLVRAVKEIEAADYSEMRGNCLEAVDKCFSKYATAKNYMEKYSEKI